MYVVKLFDPWKSPLCTCPPKYSLAPYTGCGHHCLYCYITSYIRNGFNPRPKVNFLNKLMRDIRKINPELPISIANSSDPYTPPEQKLRLTRKCLEILIPYGFKILLVTKSSLIVRDVDILKKGNVAVSMTITTLNEKISKILEPNAPLPSERLKALKVLIENGIPCSVRIDPLIPFINYNIEELRKLVKELAKIGVKHIVSSTYKVKYDNLRRMLNKFPNLTEKYRELYFEKGEIIHGYRYLPKKLRYDMLKTLASIVNDEGLSFAVCREGFTELNTGESCDGTHLIPIRKEVRLV